MSWVLAVTGATVVVALVQGDHRFGRGVRRRSGDASAPAWRPSSAASVALRRTGRRRIEWATKPFSWPKRAKLAEIDGNFSASPAGKTLWLYLAAVGVYFCASGGPSGVGTPFPCSRRCCLPVAQRRAGARDGGSATRSTSRRSCRPLRARSCKRDGCPRRIAGRGRHP